MGNTKYYDMAVYDAVLAVGIIGVFGLVLLLAAFDDLSTIGFGVLRYARVHFRLYALIGANAIIGLGFLLAYIGVGVTPRGIWHGAMLWWYESFVLSKTLSVVIWGLLLSPIMSLGASLSICRAWRMDRDGATV